MSADREHRPTDTPRPGTTDGAGQRANEEEGRTFPCESCGADLEFHIGQQRLSCPYCGFAKELDFDDDAAVAEQDYHAMLDRLARQRETDEPEPEAADVATVVCDSCGATVVFRGRLTSSECAYCDAPTQRRDVHRAETRVPVDGVLPFRIERKTARIHLKAWIRGRWFAPGDFMRRGAGGRFNGVYMPFWTFDTLTSNRYRGERGEHYWVTVGTGDKKRRVRRTRWYPASGSFQRFFDDVLVCAATGLPMSRVRALEPWPLELCVPFRNELLAGFYAETYAKGLSHGFRAAKKRIDSAVRRDVGFRIGEDDQRIHSIHTRYNALTYKHLLLPVWLLAYRYRDKTYRVVVNAATGEVQGERPYSWIKILLAVLAVLLVVGAVAGAFALQARH